MISDLRNNGPTGRIASAIAWVAAWVVLAAVQYLVVRACAGDGVPLLRYAGYFALHVYLPGVVALWFVKRGPVSLTESIALGVPTGFALEILVYVLVSALGGQDGLAAMPVVWIALAVLIRTRSGHGPLRVGLTRRHAGLALGVAVLFAATAIATTSHMFAESPLVGGLPQRPIFHDWIYLVSRTGAIKGTWPFEDPSLAGLPLHYHYFMLVHVASASTATGLEVTQVLLRFALLPLGLVLVVQAYALGRIVARSPWAGLLAALLTVAASEMALHPHANESVFLGRFVRWLHVSPTFHFGVVFFGALLLAMIRWRRLARADARHLGWFALLAAAATGAKGTVTPVILVALALWAAWELWCTRVFPTRLVVAGAVGGSVFLAVYFATMSGWGTGAAKIVPGDVFGVSEFWRQHFPAWSAVLARGLPAPVAAIVAGVGCGAVVFVGTLGVRVLAVPFLLAVHPREQRAPVVWVGAAFVASAGMGLMLRLDADSELYVFLLVRLPAAVLAAALLAELIRRAVGSAGAITASRSLLAWPRRVALLVTIPLLAVLALQVTTAIGRLAPGLRSWEETARFAAVDPELGWLTDALRWVRRNAEPHAVLVASAFTPSTMEQDHWGALDGTLLGVHYYYSALSERRLWVEGPHYALHTPQVIKRMDLAEEIFAGKRRAEPALFGADPAYLLIDRIAPGGAQARPVGTTVVFANRRIEIHRVRAAAGAASADASQ